MASSSPSMGAAAWPPQGQRSRRERSRASGSGRHGDADGPGLDLVIGFAMSTALGSDLAVVFSNLSAFAGVTC